MCNWINKMAEDYSYMAQTHDTDDKTTAVNLVIASDDVDVSKMYKLLSTNGFPVIDVCVLDKQDVKPSINIGERVTTNASYTVGKDVMVKTPCSLYTIASVVLPSGCIGDVVGVTEKTASVLFDANIKVEATDRSGYTDTMDYYVESVEVPLDILNILK